MKKISALSLLFLSVSLLTSVQAQEKKSSEQAKPTKILNPAEHDPDSGTHYGQTIYGTSVVAQHPGNNTVVDAGKRGVGGQGEQLPSGREVDERKYKEQQQANIPKPPPAPEVISAQNTRGHVPVYERGNLFNSYLKGIIENVTPVHISARLLTSSLDLPQGDLMIDVAKRDENNIRAFALIIRLSDGSQTSVFQADRGENFKTGNLVQAPIILLKDNFIIGTFKKM